MESDEDDPIPSTSSESESDEDDPIPSTSSAIPKVTTKKRVMSEDQKERKRAMDRQRIALKRKAEMLTNPEQFKAKNKANVKKTRSRQILANPEKFKEKTNASKRKIRSRQKKVKSTQGVIGRIHAINPAAGELYFLRMLLFHVKEPTSYEDLLILPSGKVCETYKQVAMELGLIADDKEYTRILEEAALTKMCGAIREMFVGILMFCQPTNPLDLFNTFWPTWTDDITFQAKKKGVTLTEHQQRTMVLVDLELRLDSFDRKLHEFSLPIPTKQELDDVNVLTNSIPAIIREELDHDINELTAKVRTNVSLFNPEQSEIFEKVMNAVHNHIQFLGFISARGGGGKTFLQNTILAAVRSLNGGSVALALGTTGIAAQLLDNGRTFHSRVKAPLKATEESTLRISAQSHLAELLRIAKLILIDESTMLNRFLLEALDKSLKDLMGVDLPFGGKSLLLSGDFRQCLPVCKGEERPGIIKQALTSSHLWPKFEILSLNVNMRVRASGNKELEKYDQWLLEIGDGKSENVAIPGHMVATQIKPKSEKHPFSEDQAMTDFCHKIFPKHDPEHLNGRVILAPTNHEVAKLNAEVLKSMPGQVETFRSADELAPSEDLLRFNKEYLNTLKPNEFPPFELNLKSQMPLILIRNLNPRQGLCNGSKMFFIKHLDHKVLQCRLEGSQRIVLIPRILFIPQPNDFPFEWSRRQFPVMPAFAMTINKSQGQTLNFVGIWLRKQCFTHGQLYVGCSRVGDPKKLKFAIMKEGAGNKDANNVVFREILLPN